MDIHTAILLAAGLCAGFIDSIAGGGGLITLPALGLVVGPGVHAIATNKIVGASGALIALLVYMRRIEIPWASTVGFSLWIMLGSFGGSSVSPYLPPVFFHWFLVASYPVILWTVWRKDFWIREATAVVKSKGGAFHPRIMTAGLACGFYDGMWGPGGGTFMLLALLLVVRMPLLQAVAASKFANTISASTALASYSMRGLVHYKVGALMAVGMIAGAYLGANLASRRAATLVRPLLVVVSTMLLLKTILGY